MEELLLDYEDFLRQRGLRIWDKNSPQALAVRRKYQSNMSDLSDPYGISTIAAEAAANTLICLINQASFLLGRQLQKLEQQFLAEGGFIERLYRERRAARERQCG